MIALDTNILARYLLNDTPAQTKINERVLSGPETCTAPITVVLELVWVLESCECERGEIAKALRLLCGLEYFKPQQFDALVRALHWYEEGMDFGDAVHLALSENEAAFRTFDKALVRLGRGLETHPAVDHP